MIKRRKILLTVAVISSLGIIVTYLAAMKELPGDDAFPMPTSILDYRLSKDYRRQWALPKILHEVSGVAVVDNHKLLIHHDEAAVVFEFGVDNQLVVPRFQLGEPVLKVDIEGIALIKSDVYLVTSTGEIYKVQDGLNRQGVIEDYEVFDTGLAEVCEIEGLGEDLDAGSLVLACKRMLDKEAKYISVYRYTPSKNQTIKLFDISFAEAGQPVHATAITTQFDGYIVLFGKEKLLGQLSAGGSIVGLQSLKKKHHPQPEGLGFLEDGGLVLADEGKKGSARITIYEL